MTFLRLFILSCLTVAVTSGSAAARCEGALMLSGLHDAYSATLRDDEEAKQRAATSLLVFLGGQSSARLADQVARAGVEVDADRLSNILIDAETLARATLKGINASDSHFRHGQNIDWLSKLFVKSGCKTVSANRNSSSASGESGGVGDGFAEPGGPRGNSGGGVPAFSRETGLLIALGLIALLAGFAFACYKFSQSFFMRRRMVERMPRFPVALTLDVTYTDPDGNMKTAFAEIVDISRGGMKLSWSEPPPKKTLVTVTLLATQRLSQVMWSNNHFAGVMFEAKLTKPEMKSLMETYPPT